MKDQIRNRLWLLPFTYGALLFGAAMYWLVMGEPFDTDTYGRVAGSSWGEVTASMTPGTVRFIEALVREIGGNSALGAGILIMAITSTAFRDGERWSWYVLWVLPMHSFIDLFIVASYGALSIPVVSWDFALIVSMLLTLAYSAKDCLHRNGNDSCSLVVPDGRGEPVEVIEIAGIRGAMRPVCSSWRPSWNTVDLATPVSSSLESVSAA